MGQCFQVVLKINDPRDSINNWPMSKAIILALGIWGLAPSENFIITVYNDRLYSMRDPLRAYYTEESLTNTMLRKICDRNEALM